jgi:hypothetical protein
VIPVEEWSKLESAKDLFELIGHKPSAGDEIPEDGDGDDDQFDPDRFDPEQYDLTELVEAQAQAEAQIQAQNLPQLQAGTQPEVSVPEINRAADQLIGIRDLIRDNQAKQAERMTTRCAAFLPDVSVGDYVYLPVKDVDRGPTDPPNIVCRIVDIDWDKSLYELACGVMYLT